ncbi:MAG: hypothetical protein Q8919_14485, partial [Bacteroidota bacterium]|nr:hypothetical protein [Bacteroidota bacterium]
MIRYFPLLLAAVLCAALASSCGSQHHNDRPLTIYDTAVLMLKEFVREGPDTNLGIKNFDELDHLILRRDYGVQVYLLLEDSLVADDSVIHIDHHMLKMGRRIYPVFYHNQLRSTITFDSTPKGWHPTVFDDSNVFVEIQEAEAQLTSTIMATDVKAAIAKMEQADSAKDSTAHAVLVAPSLHDYVV